MAEIKALKDYNNETIYPQSVTQAILDAEGNNLDAIHDRFITSSAVENVGALDIEHEITSNKIVNIDNTSTDIQYPSAKAVYDFVLANKDVGINMEVVDSLPTENINSKTIYLVKSEGSNTYGMWVYVNNEWREVGSTEIDLSNYFQKTGDTVTGNITMTSGTNIINSVSNAQIKFLANGNIRIDAPLSAGGSAAITVGTNGINLINGTTAVVQTTETNINLKANTSMTNHALTDLIDPTNTQDAATKNYVDNNIPDVSNFATKTEVSSNSIPRGLICMWSGATVPTGWNLCDGTNGTPDLRDRFIIGAGNEYSIGNTGGSANVALTEEQMPSHYHVLYGGSTSSDNTKYNGGDPYGAMAVNVASLGTEIGGHYTYRNKIGQDNAISSKNDGFSISTNSKGTGIAHENRPPYYALAFIMKL